MVCHLKRDFATVNGQTDLRTRTLGMPVHVGERFLENAEKSNFDFLWHPLKSRRQVGRNCDRTALGKTVDIPSGGGRTVWATSRAGERKPPQ
jgi:hypothetical protein